MRRIDVPTEFKGLVEEYRSRSDIHSVFGLVLYTPAHAHVSVMLSKKNFWDGLDEISGKRLVIFSIRSISESEQAVSRIMSQLSKNLPTRESGIYQMMGQIPHTNDPLDNLSILPEFGIENENELPLLLLFTKLPEGGYLQLKWKFSAKNEAQAYNNLSKILKKAADSVADVLDENIKNDQAIFDLLKDAKLNYDVIHTGKKLFPLAKLLKSVFGQ